MTTMMQAVMIGQGQPELLDHLDYAGAPSMRVPLAAGSVNIVASDGALLAIERLPVESLPMAIRRSTLNDRCAALKALTPWAYLIIVGELSVQRNGKAVIAGQPSGWDWRAIQGALATVQELGVVVLYAGTDAQFGELLQSLARRDRGPVKASPVRDLIFATPAELLLTAIPGIGEDKAESLLTQCGYAAMALVALTNPAYAPTGIGPKTIAAARAALGLPEGMNLSLDKQE